MESTIQTNFIEILDTINNEGINENNSQQLYDILRNMFSNISGIDNNILAFFDNINFITENEKGINVSKDNILTKKGILFDTAYKFRFEFKNNIYSYDIIKNKNNKLERTNFKLLESSSVFEKDNMFNLEKDNKFFKINKSFENEDFHNDIYNLMYKINQVGFNKETSLEFNQLFKYIRFDTIQKLFSSFEKTSQDGTIKQFIVKSDDGSYELVPCIKTYNNLCNKEYEYFEYYNEVEYDFTECDFEKNEFLLFDEKNDDLFNIASILCDETFHEYSLKEI